MDRDGPQPFSAHDYFDLLFRGAKRAEAEGNYAIAAAATVRSGGVELVTLGTNTVFVDQNPTGHAEVNAIMGLRSVTVRATLGRGDERNRSIIIRPAPDRRTTSTLYATLEPCPMCTVCIINAGINRVVIASKDPPSGSLADQRLKALPTLWPELAKGLEVVWAQSEQPSATDTFLPQSLRTELMELFSRSRTSLDDKLGRDGALDIGGIGKAVAGARAKELRAVAAQALSRLHTFQGS
jgi:tRNA(Arg) A34 adenosine deaminase TadA